MNAWNIDSPKNGGKRAADIAEDFDEFDDDDLPPDEQEAMEEKVVDSAVAATIAELKQKLKH